MAKKKEKTKRVFVLNDGTRYDVTGEDGKYVFCGQTQFRKAGGRGEIVEEKVAAEPEKAPEDDAEATE